MAYDAFISYSHAGDGLLAPRLQQSLQRFAKPWWRRRALGVFRDETALSANPGLWSSITAALDETEWFVLLASPDAADSAWVNREVQYWCAHKDPSRVLPVLTEGEWAWDADAGDFDWAACTAVPLALRGVFSEEPRHVDMRWARSETQLDLRNGRFRDQVAELAAPMHGLAKDEIEGEDVRAHRRTMRIAWAAVVALVLMLGASVAAGAQAVRAADEARASEQEAVESRDEADRQAALAVSSAGEAERRKQQADETRPKLAGNAIRPTSTRWRPTASGSRPIATRPTPRLSGARQTPPTRSWPRPSTSSPRPTRSSIRPTRTSRRATRPWTRRTNSSTRPTRSWARPTTSWRRRTTSSERRTLGSMDLDSCDLGSVRGLRIGAHVGPVYEEVDPFTGQLSYMGANVTRAARIEPGTPEGEVYVTHPFAALAELQGAGRWSCQYVGIVPTAKGYGRLPMYLLRRAAPDDLA